jgi:hypothetical protein
MFFYFPLTPLKVGEVGGNKKKYRGNKREKKG